MPQLEIFRTDGRGGRHASGSVTEALFAQGMHTSQLRTLDTLQKDEWLQFDSAVVEAARERLVVVNDLARNLGLTFGLNNGLGTTILEWQDMADMGPASVDMDGTSEPETDRVTFSTQGLPLPLVHHGFYLSRRVMEASRRRGESLDVTMADNASRQVSEKIEDIAINGISNFQYGGYSVDGLTTHPNRSTVTLSTNWDASAKSPGDILSDVLSMLQSARDNNFHGPFRLYVPSNYEQVLDDDYDVSGSSMQTIRDRLLRIRAISDVVVADKLSNDNVVLVQTTRNVIDFVRVLNPQMLEWQTGNPMSTQFMVVSSILPRIKSTAAGTTGIVHLS